MPVIIHEIEVVPGPDQAAAGKASGPQAKPSDPPSSVGARDVFRIQRHLRERGLRVWAH